MTLSEQRHDAHHDLTWLVGALARALFERSHDNAAVMAGLQRLAGCDFDALPTDGSRALAAACKWLPEAAVAALDVAEEPAMALAASLRHLCWRTLPCAVGEAAQAQVVGARGPLRCARAGVSLLIAGPGCETSLPCRDGHEHPENAGDTEATGSTDGAVLFMMAGEATFRDAHGVLRHAGAGNIMALHGGARMAAGKAPVLAVLLKVA